MDPTTLWMTALLALLPISELRGAIPYAVLRGMGILPAALLGTAINALVPFLAYLFLSTIHKLLYKATWYKKLFDRFVEKARIKVHAQVEKYGYWGLLAFVAIPLPMTGAWTGTLGAWVLGMEWKKASLAIVAGVIVAGIVVSLLVTLLGPAANTVFFKAFK
ncbi:MAG: small multi-drug export protein [Spirochaetes bacterium]|nr:small multi-drug export protein [Spirochaetota bacterium]